MGYKHHVPILNSVLVAVSAELCTGRHFAKQNCCLSVYQGTDWRSLQRCFEHIVRFRMRLFGSVHTRVCTRIHTVHDVHI